MIPTQSEVLSEYPQGTSQLSQIKQHLLEYNTITSWQAITKYGITRIAEHVRVLRNRGFEIETKWVKENGKRFGLYILKKNK